MFCSFYWKINYWNTFITNLRYSSNLYWIYVMQPKISWQSIKPFQRYHVHKMQIVHLLKNVFEKFAKINWVFFKLATRFFYLWIFYEKIPRMISNNRKIIVKKRNIFIGISTLKTMCIFELSKKKNRFFFLGLWLHHGKHWSSRKLLTFVFDVFITRKTKLQNWICVSPYLLVCYIV